MIEPIRKLSWQDRVVAIHIYHTERLRLNKSWSIRDTAKVLNKSHGSICQDLQLAEFLRSHEIIGKFKNYVDALEWMKKKKEDLQRKG